MEKDTPRTQAPLEGRDPFDAGLFPICPATHDLGIRRLFDLATLLLLLDCRPGDRVLDLGAGAGFASEMLARLGYDVIAVDPDFVALRNNRRRPTFDASRIEGTVQVVQAIAEKVPFQNGEFDGVLGMNVLHHIRDLSGTLSELTRVLRPGCRAVFCEPGLDHLDEADTKRAIREIGDDDRPFDVIAFLNEAKTCGFSQAMLTATLQPPLRLLPVEVELYLTDHHPRKWLTSSGVIEELRRRHAYAMLVREGSRPVTSRHPSLMRGEITLRDVPAAATRGTAFSITVRATNTGDTLWLARPQARGGYVTAGCKFLADDGRLVTDRFGRTFLPHDVAPAQTVTVQMVIYVPQEIDPGRYYLVIDLVDELICWFSDLSSEPPIARAIDVT